MTAYNGVLDIPVAEQMKHTTPGPCRHLSSHGRRIGWAFDTPFKWTKQIASHFGGTRQGLRGKMARPHHDVGGIRAQFHIALISCPQSWKPRAPLGGQRDQAEADRRRGHGVHIRQGQYKRAFHAQNPILRDGRQPR